MQATSSANVNQIGYSYLHYGEYKPDQGTWLEHRQGEAREEPCVPLLLPPAQRLYGMTGGVMAMKAFTLENMVFDPQLDEWELAVVGEH